MEDTEFRPALKKEKSSMTLTNPPKKQFTSPRIQEFERTANKYKSYLGGFNSKIDKICEKEQYRNYLKEQKLNSIKDKLEDKKNQLSKLLQDKRDPIKSPNGKIYSEILSLQKLEASYAEILEKIIKNVKQKKQQIEELNKVVQQQKGNIKSTLKESFCETFDNQTATFSKRMKSSLDQSILRSRDSSCSYKSKQRQSMTSKAGNSWQQQAEERINEQQEKIIMLRLFCVFAKSGQTATDIPSSTIELVERQVKTKNGLLFEIKQIMNKQDKKSLHGD